MPQTGEMTSRYETSRTVPEAREQTGQEEGPELQMQKTQWEDEETDPQTVRTPDSSVHRCREETGADPVPRHEVPQVERRQR